MNFLDPMAIAKLDSMALVAKVIVEGALTGMHKAKLRGASVEFAEHKEYSQGDEIRHIDWKVLGKADRYYIKQYEQDSEMNCYLVLDATASMNYQGSGVSKRAYAASLMAGLVYLLSGQQDRVGLSIFGDGTLRTLPPKAKSAHMRTLFIMLDKVFRNEQSGKESMATALERVAEQARRRKGLIVVASDLFEPDNSSLEILKHLRAKGHDTVLFHILDRDEITFPFEDLSIFESLEDKKQLLVDPNSIRHTYQKRIQEFIGQTKASCLDAGIEYNLTPTDQAFEQSLMLFLAKRLGLGPVTERPQHS